MSRPRLLAAAVSAVAAVVVLAPLPSLAVDIDAPRSPAARGVIAARYLDLRPAPLTVEIGRSRLGRPLTATRYGRVSAPRTVVVIGLLHGNEPAGLRVVQSLREMEPARDTQVWVVPTGNPDGLARSSRTNAAGVDINRNFPHDWRYAGRGTGTYSGPSAASEPETKALIAFLAARRPQLVLIFHQPLYGVDTYGAKNPTLAHRLAVAMGLPEKSFSCGGVCHGTLTGWFNATQPGMAITVEFAAGNPSSTLVARVARAVLTVR